MFLYMAQPATWPVQRFRATLDRILDETGLPQAGLAALVPMDQSQLSRWKSGSSRPKFESLKVLGEALRAKYPQLAIGPNELLESAGYAPPEPISGVGPVARDSPEMPKPGVRIEQVDDGHLQAHLTIETDVTMDEVIERLAPLSPNEESMIANMKALELPPAEIGGTILMVRGFSARGVGQHESRPRRRA